MTDNQTLTRKDLMTLETYAVERPDFRARVINHKRHRRVSIGDHLNLYFEDRLTIQYQVQEMLRIEKIFEPDGIQEELDAYNPLIPTGRNLKCTAMLEYRDVNERKRQLAQLRNIENLVYAKIDGFDRVYAIANEDLERSNDEKTSAVHFMRFELTDAMVAGMREGAALSFGAEHDLYRFETVVADATKEALLADLQ